MTKDPGTIATEHAAFVVRLLKLTSTFARDRAVREVTTHGKDMGEPTIGRLALLGSPEKPRVGVITVVTPTRVTVSHFTDNAIREAKRTFGLKSYPVHLDGWPADHANRARNRWSLGYNFGFPDAESYAQDEYQWALNAQTVFRAVRHFPFIAYTPIRNTAVFRDSLVMIPENGESQ
jgi:hypothetical protein